VIVTTPRFATGRADELEPVVDVDDDVDVELDEPHAVAPIKSVATNPTSVRSLRPECECTSVTAAPRLRQRRS
jgi:hypothetical protein